jgi:hypothetical protein
MSAAIITSFTAIAYSVISRNANRIILITIARVTVASIFNVNVTITIITITIQVASYAIVHMLYRITWTNVL